MSPQTPTLDEAQAIQIRAPWPRRLAITAALLGALFVAAAVAYAAAIEHSAPVSFRAAAVLPADVDARLRSDPGLLLDVPVAESILDELPVLTGTFPIQRPGVDAPHDIGFTFFFAQDVTGPAPAIVVTPILGGHNEIARLIAKDLATHGFHAIVVDRRWAKTLGTSFEVVESHMRDMVAGRRRAIDWLLTRDDVDRTRIGAYGVSLGGITTVNLAGADSRIKASVAVMAGGDLPSVLCRSVEKECIEISRANGVGPKATAADLAAFEAAGRAIIETCPKALAPYIDPASIVIFTTRRDTSVPTFLQERLREALGTPETYSLPTGHYSAIIYLPVILDRAREFLTRRFSP
jgi:dienelactone hydrolase